MKDGGDFTFVWLEHVKRDGTKKRGGEDVSDPKSKTRYSLSYDDPLSLWNSYTIHKKTPSPEQRMLIDYRTRWWKACISEKWTLGIPLCIHRVCVLRRTHRKRAFWFVSTRVSWCILHSCTHFLMHTYMFNMQGGLCLHKTTRAEKQH